MLIAFVLLGGAFAGGGIMLTVAALAVGAVSCYFFLKCKPWEEEGNGR
jgi:hypothetical protein